MSIAYTTGSSGSLTSAAGSVASGAFVATATQDLVVGVAIADTTKSVSSISDTAGNTYTFIATISNSGNVRTELWKAHNITGNASNVVTANLSGSSLAAIAVAEYSAASAVSGNTNTNTGSGTWPRVVTTTQRVNNWAVGVLGFTCVSGDTTSANLGTSRQSSIPAATAVGIVLVDYAIIGQGGVPTDRFLSASRQWASVGLELDAGGSTVYTFNSAVGDVFAGPFITQFSGQSGPQGFCFALNEMDE